MQVRLSATIITAMLAWPAFAQSNYSASTDWTRNWGFRSASQESVALQRAQVIRKAQQPEADGPSTVVYNTTDNRSNYIENVSEDGTVESYIQNGDKIGTNTNAVGSMNTGSTTVTVEGRNNEIVADNWAENAGCIDGSVSSIGSDEGDGGDGVRGGDLGPFARLAAMSSGTSQQICR